MPTSIVASPATVAVPSAFMGLHVGLNIPFGYPGAEDPIDPPSIAYDIVRTLKAEVDGISEAGFWSNIETSEGVYDWSLMDQWMTATGTRPVVWVIYGTPSFYQEYPGETSRWPSWPGIQSPPTAAGHTALAAFAAAAKARYGSRIVAFEVWNEPTLPWDGSATSYSDRWSPAWAAANAPSAPPPFFSGSASDLANIAYTLANAGLGVPILGCAFVDQWDTDKHTVTRFLNAPVTLSGGSGTGKDQIDALSIHFYDYSDDPTDMIDAVNGYQTKITAAGVGSLDMWMTEIGAEAPSAFVDGDPDAPARIAKWVLLAAALGMQCAILYTWGSDPANSDNLADIRNRADVRAAVESVSLIRGKTITSASVLDNGTVLVVTSDFTSFRVPAQGGSMAAPSRIQSSLIPASVGGTTSVTLSGVAQDSSILVFVGAKVAAAQASDPMQITYTKDGGAPVAMTQVARRGLQWEGFKAVTFAWVTNVDAGDYAINVALKGDTSNTYVIGAAYEVGGTGNLQSIADGDTLRMLFTANGVNSIGPFILPGSGSFGSSEIMLLTSILLSDDPSETDVNANTPVGHTLRHAQEDLTSGKQGFLMYDATLASDAQVSLTFDSVNANDYGRAGLMVALVNLGGTTQRKVLIEHERDDTLDGTTGITVEVFANPGEGHPWTGTKLFKVENCEWHNEDIGGTIKTVMRFNVPDPASWYTSQVTLSADDTCVVIGGIPGTGGYLIGTGGFVTAAVGTVYEEVIE